MKPTLEALHGGWAAVGDGWTAYGSTRGEALQVFRLALKCGKRRRTPSHGGSPRAVSHRARRSD